MLAAPLKISKPVVWDQALKEYVKHHYGGESVANEFTADFQRLNNARTRACQASVADEVSLESLRKYLSLLNTVEARFPSLKGGEGKTEWRSLSFSWTDAFRPKKTMALTDIEFERASVLFNLGALESLAGIQQDLKTVESLKAASASFGKAAGIFASLERGMLPEGDDSSISRLKGTLTSDLSPEGLAMLKYLMLAQTQSCFFERALMEEMRPSTLAKVAAQVAKFYDQSLTCAKNPTLAKVLDAAWASHLEFHKRKNESWCAYYKALAVQDEAKKTGNGYGDQIAWLTRAESTARAAWEWASKRGLPNGIVLPIKNLLEKIQSELDQAILDNKTIYFQKVPDVSTLPTIEGHTLAKAVPLEERLLNRTPNDEPIFKNLLIPWMRTAEQDFQNKKSSLVKNYGNRVTDQTNYVRQGLFEAGLPAAVEDQNEGEGSSVPASLWNRITEYVINRGGVDRLIADSAENRQSNQFLTQKLQDLEKDLNAENGADTETRNRFGPSFSAQPSRQLNTTMFADIKQYRNLLGVANKSDDSVGEKIRQSVHGMDILKKSREELASFLPDVKVAIESDPNVDRVRQELSLLLVDLGLKVQECETAQTQLVEAVEDATIVPDLEKNGNSQKANEVINAGIAKFNSFTQEVDTKLSSITAMFSVVLEKNHSFAALRTQNEATKLREQALASIDSAVEKYKEISNLNREGARFYSDLGSQVEQLSVVVQDYCFVRNVEREEFIASKSGGNNMTNSRAAASSFVDEPSVPIFNSNPVPSATIAPPQYRSAPPPPVFAAPVSHPKPELQRMKSALGMYDIPDQVLEPYLKNANGDINLAVDKYFESPPPPAASAPPAPSTQGSSKPKGGWFQKI